MADIGFRPLAKLIILPLKDDKVSGIPFVAMYNPTSISIQHSQDFAPKKNAGVTPTDQEAPVEVKSLANKSFSIDLFLDGTGASPPMGSPTLGNLGPLGSAIGTAAGVAVSAVGVEALIDLFFKTTIEVKADTHNTNEVKLIWGAGFLMNCRLQSATVNYTLINRLGLPLRATISASFLATKSSGLGTLASLLFSPDLTKLHTVKAGDTIYNIAKNEYDDESYYLQIAQANDLKNYRRLKPGMQLILPPIKKDE